MKCTTSQWYMLFAMLALLFSQSVLTQTHACKKQSHNQSMNMMDHKDHNMMKHEYQMTTESIPEQTMTHGCCDDCQCEISSCQTITMWFVHSSDTIPLEVNVYPLSSRLWLLTESPQTLLKPPIFS